MKKILSIISLIFCNFLLQAQTPKEFREAFDSLSVLMRERSGVTIEVKAKKITRRDKHLDFLFTDQIGDYPWRKGDLEWFSGELQKLFPARYSSLEVGNIKTRNVNVSELRMAELKRDGKPFSERFRTEDKSRISKQIVRKPFRPEYNKGLSGRHIALWQSHGRYYNQRLEKWVWQRPCLFQTCEDMFTQAFVLPFLAPMLENAGANCFIPRERDVQANEIIADNDTCFDEDSLEFDSCFAGLRSHGRYAEEGRWKDAGKGFADSKAIFTAYENPFRAGTARQAECVTSHTSGVCRAIWDFEVNEPGKYAVYVSYKSLPNSTESALYTVKHSGGETEFIVNQKIGGGTWIYLGSFDFAEGAEVTLSNVCPSGEAHVKGSFVTADAVRLGGGMGNIARFAENSKEPVKEVSGFPRFVEGARYSMQWYGVDSTVFNRYVRDDYTDDFGTRGAWTGWLSGGSHMNPKEEGLGIPIDLSLGFHTDAGVTPNDSIVGTLGIYTLKCDDSRRLPSGEDRMICREYTDIIQTQIVEDLRLSVDSLWMRRGTWDRSYSESRTPATPATLLELLSHQNFADMRYGLDPSFRFTVARAVYKGMLKFLSNRYGFDYAVQPLPVKSFACEFASSEKVKLSWRPVMDKLEPTAVPRGYILYTSVDGSGFDCGTVLDSVRELADGRLAVNVPIEKGRIYSFRISAWNQGGESFPSETLSAGIPEKASSDRLSSVLIVNNFDRISAPAWYDSPDIAGFDNRLDSGVPYMYDISFIGEQYQNRRKDIWTDDENPGFGASHQDYAGQVIAGNTFNYPYIHGASFFRNGLSFCSSSSEAFTETADLHYACIDLICGKQVTTVRGPRDYEPRHRVFTDMLQQALKSAAANGSNLIVSGAHIGTDVWSSVYPVRQDSLYAERTKAFIKETLGWKWSANFASHKALVKSTASGMKKFGRFSFGKEGFRYNNEMNSRIYCVEAPDAISPAGNAVSVFRYADTGLSAGVCYIGKSHKAVSLGFPIETVEDSNLRDEIFRKIIQFFK